MLVVRRTIYLESSWPYYFMQTTPKQLGQDSCSKLYGEAGQEMLKLTQCLEGYSRDPGFDPKLVRDSGKRKIS